MTPWDSILPESDMLFGTLTGDDITKLVAAIGVLAILVKQWMDSSKLSKKHDDTQLVLNTLLGVLTNSPASRGRRSTDGMPAPGTVIVPQVPPSVIITPPVHPPPTQSPPTQP